MKHWAAFAIIVLVISGALVWSEIHKVEAPVGPEPILNLVADGEHELTRLPVAFLPLSDSEEIKIGKELEKSYAGFWRQGGDEAQNRAIEDYVQKVGAQIAAHARRKLPYRFHYIPSLDFVNAFALPGGPVFIGGGLMALMDTEDELAAVLGHEIEHIDHYHCAERIQVEAALRRIPVGQLVALPVEIFVAGYSKNQELEADREGTRLAAAASYSPQGAIQMFEAFERLYPTKNVRSGTPQEELSEIARKALEGYFRSHPLNAERIDQIRRMIAGGQVPAWNRTKPFPLAYLFLTERAWRSLQTALAGSYPYLTAKEKQKQEAERVKQYQEAARLASQALDRKPDQPRAMEVLAVAKFALGDYAAAAAIYHKLVPDSPTFADGIRVYADALARQALVTQQYEKAAKLARQSLELQPNQPDALKILAEAQFWTADFTGAAETCHKLNNLYPQAADEVRLYADRLALTYWGKHQYQEAASLAALSLDLKPGQPQALAVLAKARFSLADFPAAAEAYRKLLDLRVSDAEAVRSYADSLSASSLTPKTARDFETWRAAAQPRNFAQTTEWRVEAAGLLLMTGDGAPARALVAEAQTPERSLITPESLGRLGWWYYRAGNYEVSLSVLRQAVAVRPGNLTLQTAVAWNELAEHRLEDAIRRFTAAGGGASWNSPVMGRAVARWQAGRTAEALTDFDEAARAFPEWRNPRWVQALFPAPIAQTVAQMDAEWQKQPHTAKP